MVDALQFLTGGGEMGARVQAHHWSTSALGPIGAWPQSLRTSLSIMLNSGFPTYLAWGPDLISFYNDAYRPFLGTKPEALGRPFQEVWAESWDTVGPIAARALAGERSYFEDLLVVIERHARIQETWWTFSYSPIRDETGGVGGVLCTVLETTNRVLAERQLRFQVDLGRCLNGLVDPRTIMAAVAELLGHHLGVGRVGYGEFDATAEFFQVERDWTDGTMPSLVGRHRVDDFGLPAMTQLRAGHTICLDDVLSDPNTSGEDTAAAFAGIGMRAGIVVPMMEDGRVRAALYVNHAKPRQWRDDELALIEEVVTRTRETVGYARAEAALRESEERFRQFAEHSTSVLWILNVEQDAIEYRSPAFERVWCRPRDTLLGVPGGWGETLHPDDQVGARNALGRLLRGEGPVTQEYRIIRPDGSVRLIRDIWFPIRDSNGHPRRVAGIARDVTPRTEALVYVVGMDDASTKRLPRSLQDTGYRVQEFASAWAFLEVAPVLVAGCVLVNVQAVEAADTVALLQAVAGRRANLPVIVVGGSSDNLKHAVQLMKAGAADYLTVPDDGLEPLLAAVATALAGLRDAADRDSTATRTRKHITEMSEREREVLHGLLSGATNKEIGRALKISPRTVELHRARVMERLGARTLSEAVMLASGAGLNPSWPPKNTIGCEFRVLPING